MKLFIYNHIKENNNIIIDGWPSYSFLDADHSSYTHETYVHSPNDKFRFIKHNFSHIKGVWSLLKRLIKKSYSNIPHNNFILF